MQIAVYPATGEGCNWSDVPAKAVSFYRWLHDWHSDTGRVFASTGYLARQRGKTERTIYRWLSALEQIGAIEREAFSSHGRLITPLVEPLPPPPKCCRSRRRRFRLYENFHTKCQSKCQSKSGQNVSLPHIDALCTEGTTEARALPAAESGAPCNQVPAARASEVMQEKVNADALVSELIKQGVTPQVAETLVSDDPAECRRQLSAVERRQWRDKAAALVAAIRGKWTVPNHQKPVKPLVRRPVMASAPSVTNSPEQAAIDAFSRLPEQEQQTYITRADAEYRERLPNVYPLTVGRPAFLASLRRHAAQMYAARAANVSP